eukprot:jgi/Chrzof1/11670/Cz06g04150.t1
MSFDSKGWDASQAAAAAGADSAAEGPSPAESLSGPLSLVASSSSSSSPSGFDVSLILEESEACGTDDVAGHDQDITAAANGEAVEVQQAELAAKQAHLATRETDLLRRTAELDDRHAALAEQESQLTVRREDLMVQESDLAADIARVAANKDEADARLLEAAQLEANLLAREAVCRWKEQQLLVSMTDVMEHYRSQQAKAVVVAGKILAATQELADRQQQLYVWEETLTNKQADMDRKEDYCKVEAARLTEGAAQLQVQLAEVEESRNNLAAKEAAIEIREQQVAAAERSLQAAQQDHIVQADALHKQKAQLAVLEADFLAQQQQLDVQQSAHNAAKASLEQEQAQPEERVLAADRTLQAEKEALRREADALEQSKAELATEKDNIAAQHEHLLLQQKEYGAAKAALELEREQLAADVKQLAANSLEAAAASAEPDLQEHHSSTTYGTKQGTTCAPSEGPGGWTQLYNQFGFLDTDQEANRIPVPAFCNEVMPAAQSQYGVEQQLFGTSAIPAPSCSMLFQPSLASHNVSSSSHMLELQHPPMAHCIYNNELFSPVKQPQPAGQCRGVLGGDGLATASFDAFSAHSSWFGTGWGSKPLFGSECQHNCSVMGQSAFPAGPGVVHVASTSGLLEVPSPLQPPPPRHNNTDAMVVMPPARKFGAGGDSLQSAGMKLDDAFDKQGGLCWPVINAAEPEQHELVCQYLKVDSQHPANHLDTGSMMQHALAATAIKQQQPPAMQRGIELCMVDLLQQAQVICKLGEGAFGCVSKVSIPSSMQEPTLAAIKVMTNSSAFQKASNLMETAALEQLRHYQHVIRMYQSIQVGGTGVSVLLLEYCPGGSLWEKIVKQQVKSSPSSPVFSEHYIVQTISRIAAGLGAMHNSEQPLVHRDIKSGNILLDSNGYPKICDFGTVAYLSASGRLTAGRDIEAGTKLYQTPEVHNGFEPCSATGLDWWGLGAVTLHMVAGMGCISREDDALIELVGQPGQLLNVLQQRQTSSELTQFIMRCLAWNPSDRLTSYEQVKQAAVFTKYSVCWQELEQGADALWLEQ